MSISEKNPPGIGSSLDTTESGVINSGSEYSSDQRKKKLWPFGKSKKEDETGNKKISEKQIEATKADLLEEKLRALPESESAVLRSQIEITPGAANLFTLFRYATSWDIFLVVLGVFFSVIHGVALPMFTLVVGAITNLYNSFFATESVNINQFQHQADHNALYFVYIGVGMLVSSVLESFLLVNRGEVIAGRWRKAYLKAVIRQNIGYFDKLGSGEIATRITNDTNAIQEAISEKLGNIIQGLATFITAIVIALARQWKLALILFGTVVFCVGSMLIGSTNMIKHVTRSDKMYSQGSTIAEEALSSVRSTVAFNAQDRLVAKFDTVLRNALKESRKANLALSFMLACIWSGFFFNYSLSYWEGSRIIAWGESSVGHVISVILAMMIGSFQFSQIAPNVRFVVRGISSAKTINETINRVPVIDSDSDEGKTLDSVRGNISLKHVRFRYPSRPDVLVLPDFSLDIEEGQTVALVGMSGSGKSTIVGILERFYLPLSGSITIDGVEITDLNVRWLRQQIGFVQQEPTLFADSIYENIVYGLIGTEYENADEETKRARVIAASKEANAYDFIQTLTEGFETNVGDRGFLLSGGQKQRIAIARAIVSNPKILLLDEATSALDTKSEGIVQEALDRASATRTTIVIAHRLSTIKDADNIVVMSKGEIVEQGTHYELLANAGYYSELVEAQQVMQLEDSPKGEAQVHGLEIQEDAIASDNDADSLHGQGMKWPEGDDIPGIAERKDGNLLRYITLLWRLNAPERGYIYGGAVCALIIGYCYPSMAMVTGEIIGALIVPPSQFHHMRHEINVLTGWFFFLGCIAFMSAFMLNFLLSYASDYLVRQVRLRLFRQLLRMDIAFFDHKDSTPGALTAVLAKEAKAIEGLGGATMGQILQSLVILIGGVATGIPFNWRIGLVGLACVPVLLGCGFLRVWVMIDLQERGRKVYESSGALASQYSSAVRTVQSLTREGGVVQKYSDEIENVITTSQGPTARSAILYGLSQGLTPWCIALIFWWGSTVMRRGEATVHSYFVVFMAIILGAQAAGQMFSYAPDMGKARQAGANIYRLLMADPVIDPYSTEGEIPDPEKVQGHIEFCDVHFRYPTRPQVPVLRGLNLKVERGQYIALVGASGCGKSTTIGLIERFYNVQAGKVLFDGKDIMSYNLRGLRNCMALVQQEPMLYSGSIRDNILLGWHGDESEVSQERIEEVCRKANIHDFITSLPDGYDTVSGSRGSLLSGGQKQRIAIARALIGDPHVLLLDEATSALDSESEKIVQAALDAAALGRTTIAIAHRLSTIQGADVIYVFDKGEIVEQGDHNTLLAMNGRYAELVRLQGLGP